jgi:hypothetical protein
MAGFKRAGTSLGATLAVVLCVVGCSGGGGGGGGGRSTKTALRIIHGSVDSPPVMVRIGETMVQKAQYAQVTDYVPVAQGPAIITVEHVNTPGDVVGELTVDFKEATEYSLFVVGETRHGDFGMTIIEEPVARPASGVARVQLLNALPDSASLLLHGTGFDIGPVSFSGSSGFVEVPMGAQTVTVGDQWRRVISQVDLNLVDQGEATVVVSGSGDLHVNYTRVYYDLD